MRKLFIIAALILFAGIAFGQTLQRGNLIGVHHYTITLLNGYTMEQVVEFYVDKFCPAYEKVFPGIKVNFIKGNRGEHEGEFGLIFLCESKESRDKYWPEKDVSSDLANEGYEKMGTVWEEQAKMMIISGDHTDYEIL